MSMASVIYLSRIVISFKFNTRQYKPQNVTYVQETDTLHVRNSDTKLHPPIVVCQALSRLMRLLLLLMKTLSHQINWG